MFAIQPWSLYCGDEELASIGVLACVCHTEPSFSVMFQFEVLIGKFLTVDGLASGTVPFSEISSLDHEGFDDSVELAVLVSESFFSSSKCDEIIDSFWDSSSEKTDFDSSDAFTSYFHIEIHLLSNNWSGFFLGISILGHIEEDQKTQQKCQGHENFHHFNNYSIIYHQTLFK